MAMPGSILRTGRMAHPVRRGRGIPQRGLGQFLASPKPTAPGFSLSFIDWKLLFRLLGVANGYVDSSSSACLVQHPGDVTLDSPRAQTQALGNLSVGETATNELNDLFFTTAEAALSR